MNEDERREFSEFAAAQEIFNKHWDHVGPTPPEWSPVILHGGPEDGRELSVSGVGGQVITITAMFEMAYYKLRGEEYVFSHASRSSK